MKEEKINPAAYLVGGLPALLGLYLLSLYSYPLFHTVIELFSAVVAFMIFILAWHSRDYSETDYFLLIGVMFMSAGIFGAAHALSYGGMNVLPSAAGNVTILFRLAGGYVQSISFLIVPFVMGKRVNRFALLGTYLAFTAGLIAAVLSGNVPDSWRAAGGLTAFRAGSEYVFMVILFGALAVFLRRREHFGERIFTMIVASIVFNIASEALFTFDAGADASDFPNLLGHFLKAVSYYLIYHAVIVNGLRRPYNLLFRSLKQSEESLRGERDLLMNSRTEIESLSRFPAENPNPVLRVNQNGTILYVNEAGKFFLRAWGCETGCPAPEEWRARVDDALKGGDARSLEYEVSERTFLLSVVPFPSSGYVNLYGHDVTELKDTRRELEIYRAHLEDTVVERTSALIKVNEQLLDEIAARSEMEESLRASENKYRTLVENLPQRIFLKDACSVYVSCNEKYARDLNILPDEISGRSDFDFYDADRAEKFREDDRRIMETGKTEEIEETIMLDGHERTVQTIKTPIAGHDGSIAGIMGVSWDITERKRLESIAGAVNTMNSIGYVFSGIRHEIGNPINSTKMVLGVLMKKLETYPDPSIRGYVERAVGELSRVEYIIKNLRNFNMHETLEQMDMELAPFLDNILKLVRNDFTRRDVRLELHVENGVEYCRADPRALQQVLLNILTNAADACEGRAGAVVSLSLWHSQGGILIRVADNGRGMGAEQKQELFKPFYTTKPHGTGLGMVIARKMLAKMNGTIEVQSWAGEGTIVDMIMPLEELCGVEKSASQQ